MREKRETHALNCAALDARLDGLSGMVVRHSFPAGRGEAQYAWEPPRTIGAVLLSSGRLKGGMTGNRKRAPNEEWLSPFGTGKVQA